ncbi:hypothetical protein [Nonomuraea cavernae]|uniref:Uncharacterized protein n=1 Tax=Nonomuraea cavernae TaxID=2045107 RepID=A0A917YSR7_9ACTN|nr:hypothetical protein [Nonomuraea cavernae]MCA2184603.1 hypothetical protein [Nonomuraea cavernae]GGO63287.1 hypothetical protein GCM10012289_09980 [Nonomuraea cavernae]
MPRKMTGPEHAEAALDYLAEAKKFAMQADKARACDWKEVYSAQASACALIAAAEFQAADLALKAVATPMADVDPHQVKEWRRVTGAYG